MAKYVSRSINIKCVITILFCCIIATILHVSYRYCTISIHSGSTLNNHQSNTVPAFAINDSNDYSFGDYQSIHVLTDACVNKSGIFYLETVNNYLLNNISYLTIHTEIESTFHHINVYKLSNTNNITFVTDPTGFLLWTSNIHNMYHLMFSLIGGFKAINIINKSPLHSLDINNIQLIYFGSYQWRGKHYNDFEPLYNKIITNISNYQTLHLRNLYSLKCYKKLIIGRASQ
eukprot:366493_1